ncbi:hypothetical protein BT96DRAFT_367245 [Gymnopus androsaceus JB14]|uniref:DUF6534 domain-containing protein n=1 Tax=Gymnopus androsaceus JB14 TaxID=1447944 RepID=A0A6A4IJX3_9AGAR|nr:hypothetical protein BT96DRAFT_367245 [Gymnopus androsaceus JB14]
MVDKLILWAIETGALTSIIGIAILVCLLTMRDNFVWLALLLILPKIFSNTLLANLNSRADLRRLRNSRYTCSLNRRVFFPGRERLIFEISKISKIPTIDARLQ